MKGNVYEVDDIETLA